MRNLLPVMALAALAFPARAHILLDEPPSRYLDEPNAHNFKTEACGKGANDARTTDTVTTYEPGEIITVRWRETIDHTGSFHVQFDVDGAEHADFNNNELGMRADPSNPNGQVWELTVTLPHVECDNCTLRLVQDMGGSNYYQCADLVLRAAGAPDAGPPVDSGVSAPDAGGGDDAGAGAVDAGASGDDAGAAGDDAGPTTGEDAGSTADAGEAGDDAGSTPAEDASASDDAGAGAGDEPASCSAHEVPRGAAPMSLALLGVLGLLLGRRRR